MFIFKENHELKNYIIEEMLKVGILASNIVYVSISHTNKILNIYFKELEKFSLICPLSLQMI